MYHAFGGTSKPMIAISLQSGSSGNCIYVETGGVRLLLDAGISGSKAEERLLSHGRDIRDVDAVIISHDHADHVRCAGIFNRKYSIPLYITDETLKCANSRTPLGPFRDIRHFHTGETLMFGGVAVDTVPTPHDGRDGCVFIINSGGKRLGVLTDLGHVFDGLEKIISTLDAVFIESNYDPEMLSNGPYPAFLKSRIRGPRGHISNYEAADLLRKASGPRMKWACLSHLSGHNNRPELALGTHRELLPSGFPLHVASRCAVSEIFAL